VQAIDPQELYPFELDPFQLQAIAALQAGKSVVVCAPTGSGKTLIGEYAIHAALAGNRRVFYTTPLKALSNQKLRDFRQQFGDDNVGLLTGDTSVNRDAPILVMTTEIFRNMLYGTPIGEVGTSLTDVEVVVLDECHYMNDRQRGTVWEESIVYCPAGVQLVALSATVANSQQLTDWIHKVHGDTELIYSDFRPVPLEHSFCNNKGFFPLLDSSNEKINPRLKPLTNKPPSKEERHKIVPPIGAVISHLRQRDMLPAIYFIFSRRGCDKAVTDLGNVSLVSPTEALRLKPQIDTFVAANPEIGKPTHIDALYRGIAAHHAGILPAWKGFVEELFQQGLIKVVFATETLAAGINMPARTTVISSISKRTDRGHRLLNASEFLQMAGRAGRRGMDEVGYVVTVQTPFEGAKEAAHLATSGADPLVSQFAPSYGMVMNLLQTHSLDQARDLVERSFGQYLADLNLAPQIQNLELVIEQIAKLEKDLANIDLKQLEVYDKLRDRLREEKRLLKMLAQQAEEMRLNDLASYAPYLLSGSPLTIRTNKGLIVHTVLAKLPLRPGQSIDGDDASFAIAPKITPLPDPELAPEVIKQQSRVIAIESEMNQHPVSKMTDRGAVFKKVNRLEQLQRQIEFQQKVVNERRQRHWQEFMSLVNIAIVSENSRPDNWIKFGLSPTVEDALDGLREVRRELMPVQRRHLVDIPAWLDYELTGLVEQWALGMEWSELCQNTNLDEGDIVRLMRRTIDLLYQIPHVPNLPSQIYSSAKQAAQMIDRFPVNEVI